MLEKLDHEIDPTVTSIHIALDNLRMHKGKQVKAWLANHPRFQFHHQPVHCSWMNQVEQWFSNDSPHLEYKQRWVNQYNFYINDAHWGRMFVRMCPYFPFSARICLNQHHWLAHRMRREGIDFEQTSNAFLKCGNPIRLQKLADSLTSRDLSMCGQKWLAMLTPFFTDKERREQGCQHRLFFSQVEILTSFYVLSA